MINKVHTYNNKILFSGGMILEVILMVSIVMMIYPVLNQQTAKRKTKLRDMLIVKEINTIKQTFERFLLKYVESFPKNTTCNIDLEKLTSECQLGKIIPPAGFESEKALLNKVYSMGLPVGLGKGSNMIGQKYSIRVRRKSIKNGEVDIVEAIVIAKGDEEVEDITIRSIVRELGFSGGYIEGNAIIGMNWYDTSNWKYSKEEGQSDAFGEGALINKLNTVKADKSLLVKYKTATVVDNTMQTDMLINNKDIKRVNAIDTKSGQYVNLKANSININTENSVDFQIDNKIKVNDGITYDTIDFDLGFKAPRGRLTITGTGDSFKFARDLKVGDMVVTSISEDPAPVRLTELRVSNIEPRQNTYLNLHVNGVLSLSKIDSTSVSGSDNQYDNVFKINALYAASVGVLDNSSKNTIKYGEVIADYDPPKTGNGSSPIQNPCKQCVLYLKEDGKNGSNLSVFKDLVVSDLNKKLDGVKLGKFKNKNQNKTYDGVIVKYDTTLGEILTNLGFEQRMVDYYINTFFDPNWGGF